MNEEIMSQIRYLSKNNSVKNIRSKLKNVMSKYRLPSESQIITVLTHHWMLFVKWKQFLIEP